MKITIQKEECINTETALRKEWIDANGLGGYASSTILNCHTRKYHGLLVAALDNPPGKYVLLSKVESWITTDRRDFHLSTNKYPGVFHPTGHKYIKNFEYSLYPAINYRIGEMTLRKSVMILKDNNTVLIRYRLIDSTRPVTLKLKPLLAYRPIHGLAGENMHIQVKTYHEKNGFKIEPYQGMPPLFICTNRRSMFFPSPEWNYGIEYMKEQRRGYPYKEDLFSPGIFEVTLKKGNDIIIGASIEPLQSQNLLKSYEAEKTRREQEFDRFSCDNEHRQFLKYSAEQFIIRNTGNEISIPAGYHWFDEWGRDAMIALPGLTFCCGRIDEGLACLDTFAKHEKNGLIPNFLGHTESDNAYNSADAVLWFFWAVQQYFLRTNDKETICSRFLPVMGRIIDSVLLSSNPNLRLLENGLIYTGDEHSQLTWMDAFTNGSPVTPRHGCPVEINALWYNALRFFSEIAPMENNTKIHAEEKAQNFEQVFENEFWNENHQCLYDVIRDNIKDPSIRPNQIFAGSLPYSPLSPDTQKRVIETVSKHLLTPYGLRTLSPGDPSYKGVYEGPQEKRDAAYHQGTVWPWLACHFAESYIRNSDNKDEAKQFIKTTFTPLLDCFPDNFGIYTIPEIYNGDPPHKPKGCISQAWSLGEIIRLSCILEGEAE